MTAELMRTVNIEKNAGEILELGERGENDFEFSNLDLKLGSSLNPASYLRKSVLEKQIEMVVLMWLSHYKLILETEDFFGNEERLENAKRILKNADKILLRLAPLLRSDPRVLSIRVKYIGRRANYQATDLLQPPGEKGILFWIAEWMKEIRPRRGRPPKSVLANCAEEIAILFKERTGRRRWEEVGRIVAKAFEQYLPPDNGKRDHCLWIRKLVMRNRNHQQWTKVE